MAASKQTKSLGSVLTHSNPAHEEEGDEPPAPLDLAKLFTEVFNMSSTLQSVATNVSTIKQTTNELNAKVVAMQERITEAETRISCLEDTWERLHTSDG